MLIVLIVHPAKFKPGVALAVDLLVTEAEDVMAADSKDEVVDVNLLFL